VRLIVLTRHAHSTLNEAHRVNGDPNVPVTITETGQAQAEQLGHQLAQVPIELCIHTRFGRTAQTADVVLHGRAVPRLEEPLLDDIDVGDLEGVTLDEYRDWKRDRTRSDPFPGGESLDDAARRYARAYERLLDRPEQTVLVVCHEIPVRYLANAAANSGELNGPLKFVANADPYLFDEASLQRAVARIRELAG